MTAFVGLYCGLHWQVARLSDCPEFVVSEPEAKAFLSAAQNVARHYAIETTQRGLDWIAFFSAATYVYLPRVTALAARRKAGPRAAPAAPSAAGPGATVFQFRPPGAGSQTPVPGFAGGGGAPSGVGPASSPAPGATAAPVPPGLSPDMTYEPETGELPVGDYAA